MAVWTAHAVVLVMLGLDRGRVEAKELQVLGPELIQASLLQSSYWTDLYQEMSAMVPVKCSPEHYSCYTNETAKKEMPCEHGIPELCDLCHCDPSCLQYGDCCLDYAASAALETSKTNFEQDDLQYDCVSLDFRALAGILMVRSCPPSYRGSKEERMCRQEVKSEEYSYILDLPVTSSASNTTYVNYFCAQCNDDAYSLVSWDMTINCSGKGVSSSSSLSTFMQDALYKPGMRLWHYSITSPNAAAKTSTCFLQVLEFMNLRSFVEKFGSRMCTNPKTVCDENARGTIKCMEQERNCDPTWNDLEVMDKCRQYSLLVSYGPTVYKNPHCAVCNYVNITHDTGNCLSLKRFSRRYRFRFPPAFSALIDFTSNPCGEEHFYDPIGKKCIAVKCGSHFTLQKGECVRKTNGLELSNSSVMNYACPKIVVSEDQFIILRNSSVFINSSQKVYKAGEYEVFNDSQILICNEDFVYLSTVTEPQKWVTFAVLLLSLVCLLAHITIYMLLPKMRNLPGRNLFSLSCSLFLAHFLFLISTHATEHNNLCIFMGLSLHYFWLASFCWMNVMSLDVYITFRGSVRRGAHAGGKTYLYYSVYAWGIPLLVILSALCVQYTNILPEYKPKYAGQMCWINNRDSLVLFFIFPIGAIVLENVALFIVTSYGIYQQTKMAQFAMKRSQSVKDKPENETARGGRTNSGDISVPNKQKKTDRKERIRLLLYIKLGVIQGLTWTTGFLAAFTGLPACWYLFTILNGLQGFFIFLSFDMKRKVWESLQKRLISKAPHPRPSKETRTTTVTASSSSGRKQSAKSQRSTTSLLGGVGVAGCRRRVGQEGAEERVNGQETEGENIGKKENTGDRVDGQNILELGQKKTNEVFGWDDQQFKSCSVMQFDCDKQNTHHCYCSNTIMPCYSDDTLHKVMDKSVQRSFKIQKIVDLLQQIKITEGTDKDQLETNYENESEETSENKKVVALHKINHGYEADENVMTRSRSLVARRSDTFRHTSPSFPTGNASLQPASTFLRSRVASQPPKSPCLQADPGNHSCSADSPHSEAWPDMYDQCSVDQLSNRHSQEQVAQILAARLKRILQGYKDSRCRGDTAAPPEGGGRGRSPTKDSGIKFLPEITPKNEPSQNNTLNNPDWKPQSKVGFTAARDEGTLPIPPEQRQFRPLEQKGSPVPERRTAERTLNNTALESTV